jgi:hypothetical protein
MLGISPCASVTVMDIITQQLAWEIVEEYIHGCQWNRTMQGNACPEQ